jgi:hypothetical protein
VKLQGEIFGVFLFFLVVCIDVKIGVNFRLFFVRIEAIIGVLNTSVTLSPLLLYLRILLHYYVLIESVENKRI